jgi:hypothetical protein
MCKNPSKTADDDGNACQKNKRDGDENHRTVVFARNTGYTSREGGFRGSEISSGTSSP